MVLDTISAGLSAPTSSALGIAGAALSPTASYEIGQYFKDKGTEGSAAHTVLGAAVAAAGGHDALTAGLIAGGAEASAPVLSQYLYGKKSSDLTAEEKSTISAITGLVATGVGGAASGDITTAVQSGQGAQNAVENNYLTVSQLNYYNLEMLTCKKTNTCDQVIKRYEKLSVSQDDELTAICSQDATLCKQKYGYMIEKRNEFRKEIDRLSYLPNSGVYLYQQVNAEGAVFSTEHAKYLKQKYGMSDEKAKLYSAAMISMTGGVAAKGKTNQVKTPQIQGDRPANYTPIGAGRNGAFNQAKKDAGIPVSMQPTRVKPNVDKRGNTQPGKQYEYDVPKSGGGTQTVILRDDSKGHVFLDDPSLNRGPHFNTPNGNHYDY